MAALRVTTLLFLLVSSKTTDNIGDPIEDIMISDTEYHTIHVYGENFAQTHVYDCMYFCKSLWPGNGSQCRFAHKLQKFLRGGGV